MPQYQVEHVAKHVLVKHESDGSIAVLMRCCGDPSTDSWHTLYVQPETSSEEIRVFVDQARSRCEAQHAARENARAIIEKEFSA